MLLFVYTNCLFLTAIACLVFCKTFASKSYIYDFESENFMPLTRIKRENDAGPENSVFNVTNFWPNLYLPDLANYTETKIDYQYYEMTLFRPGEPSFSRYYIDVDRMLENPLSKGGISHPLLLNSHRRAASVDISFSFPFYGHPMNSMTITTGGFCYIGDQSHSWLAATQYIAPLMGNFATTAPNSRVKYADNGTVFVVEWDDVILEDNAHRNQKKTQQKFSFQASLHKNGDIWFVYKTIPMEVDKISESNHPRKLGISDAYLFEHNLLGGRASQACIQVKSCSSCNNMTLKHFDCTWCEAKHSDGGPFCSDEAGLHRRRQQWINGNCKEQGKNVYCAVESDVDETDETTDKQHVVNDGEHDRMVPDKKDPPKVVPLGPRGRPDLVNQDVRHIANNASNRSTGGMATLFALFGLALVMVAWLLYAYYNPHSASGQLLIRYRPNKWHWPNGEVRYTPSVHM